MRDSDEFKRYVQCMYEEAQAKFGNCTFSHEYTWLHFENDMYEAFDRNILQPRINAKRSICKRNKEMRMIGKLTSKKIRR